MPRIELSDTILWRGCTHPVSWLNRIACHEASDALVAAFDTERDLDTRREALIASLHRAVPKLEGAERKGALEAQRALRKKDPRAVEALGKLAHALPAAQSALAEELKAWTALETRFKSLFTQAEETFARELERARHELGKILADRSVQEAILLSSQSLYEGLQRYLAHPPKSESASTKHSRQFERSAAEHLLRAILRPVPRGTLVGAGATGWSDREKVSSGPVTISARRTLVSLPYLRKLAREISSHEEVSLHVVPRVNPTLSIEDAHVTFWASEGDMPNATLLRLPLTPVLESFLRECDKGVFTAHDLIERIATEVGFETEQIREYYGKLVARQVVFGHLEIPFERPDGVAFLCEWLERLPPGVAPAGVLERLLGVRRLLGELDQGSLAAQRPALYDELRTLLGAERLDQLITVDVAIEGSACPSVAKSEIQAYLAKCVLPGGTRGHLNPELLQGRAAVSMTELYNATLTRKRITAPPEKLLPSAPPRYPGMGMVTFQMSSAGEIWIRGPKLVGHFARFLPLIDRPGRAPGLELFRRFRMLQKQAYPEADIVDIDAGATELLANAAWFPYLGDFALETKGPPFSEVPRERMIRIRDLEAFPRQDGIMGVRRRGGGREVRFSHTQSVDTPALFPPVTHASSGWEIHLPESSVGLDTTGLEETPSPRPRVRMGKSIVVLSTSIVPLPEIPEAGGAWEKFVAFQRYRRRWNLPRLVQMQLLYRSQRGDLEDSWAEGGEIDFDNPFVGQAQAVLFRRLTAPDSVEPFDSSRIKLREILIPEGEFSVEFAVPFFVLPD
jgi:hypothetical protein